MTDEESGHITRFFADLVPDDVIGAYTKLHATGGVVKERAAEFLGADGLVDELAARGMAHFVPHTPSGAGNLPAGDTRAGSSWCAS